jgi:hypothetical protein
MSRHDFDDWHTHNDELTADDLGAIAYATGPWADFLTDDAAAYAATADGRFVSNTGRHPLGESWRAATYEQVAGMAATFALLGARSAHGGRALALRDLGAGQNKWVVVTASASAEQVAPTSNHSSERAI